MSEDQFWEIIEAVKWDGDVSASKLRLKNAIKSKEGVNFDDVNDFYSALVVKINVETDRRIDNEEKINADHIFTGGDDYHYMDMPGEIISKGKAEVDGYLSGKTIIQYEARECLHYIFHR